MEYYAEASHILPRRTSFVISNAGNSSFIVDDSHVKIVWLHVVVFSEHDILHFLDNFHLFKYNLVKVPQNSFNSFNYLNQTYIQVSKFLFALDK